MILTSEVEVLQTPLQSPSDRKNYKFIRLPNGLKAVLVESPSNGDENVSGETTVCLCIDAGSFDDPKNVQGLSHFLEHMVGKAITLIVEQNRRKIVLGVHGVAEVSEGE